MTLFRMLGSLMLLGCFFSPLHAYYEGSDLGYLDEVTLNGRAFESFAQRQIEFYPEDLKNGFVVIRGLMEREADALTVEELGVEVSLDGGATWQRADGHRDWEFAFRPETGRTYELSLRVVRTDADSAVSEHYRIAGFELIPDADALHSNGRLSGGGRIVVDYFAQFGLPQSLPVRFEGLTVSEGAVTAGSVTCDTPLRMTTDLADVDVTKIVIDAVAANGRIEGSVDFKGVFESTAALPLPAESRLRSDGFEWVLPVGAHALNIWDEQDVTVALSSGSVRIAYDGAPGVSVSGFSGELRLGTLLTDAAGGRDSVTMALGASALEAGAYTARLGAEARLLGGGIALPPGAEFSLDLSDLSHPSLGFTGSVDLSGYDNPVASRLDGARIAATVSPEGFSATVSAENALSPLVLLERGGEGHDVRVLFEGAAAFTIAMDNEASTPRFDLPELDASIDFGDLLQRSQSAALSAANALSADLRQSAEGVLNLSLEGDAYLFGTGIRLPSGMAVAVDITNLSTPALAFAGTVDLSGYDHPIARMASEVTIDASASPAGFDATLRAAGIAPITLLDRGGDDRDVRVVFNPATPVSLHVAVGTGGAMPELSVASVDASLSFGDLLQEAQGEAASVVASLGSAADALGTGASALSVEMPAKVRLLGSPLAVEGLNVTLDLDARRVAISGSADLEGYGDNALLQAFDGALFEATVDPSGFVGSMSADGGLEPVTLLDRGGPGRDVRLSIDGTPSVRVSVGAEGPAFAFGSLQASVDFGDVLQRARSAASGAVSSVTAVVSDAANATGGYRLSFADAPAIYLLGSNLGLSGLSASFNLEARSLTLAGTADLSAYESPLIAAFNGASFGATLDASGFTGFIEGGSGIEPITILARGGAGHDVALEFTEAPRLNVALKSSGVDLGVEGGAMALRFGDLMEGAVAELEALRSGAEEGASAAYAWSISGSKRLLSASQAVLSDLGGELDLSDLNAPRVVFNATADLSGYGGIASTIRSASLRNGTISREGFSAALRADVASLPIWSEKGVALNFKKPLSLGLSLSGDGVGFSIGSINAELDFGTLLADAKAEIRNVAEGTVAWSLTGAHDLAGSGVMLSGLGGSLDLADISNPGITLNAMADLSRYGGPFNLITRAGVEDARISKSGFEGTLVTEMERIDIWADRNVRLLFDKDQPPKFRIAVGSGGVRVGVADVRASLDFGDVLSGATAWLEKQEGTLYGWGVDGAKKIGGTEILLGELAGSVDLGDLRSPVVSLRASADLSGYSATIADAVSLENATLSKEGFSADFAATLRDMTIYAEKQVRVDFDETQPARMHLAMDRSGVRVALTGLDASLDFGQMLDGTRIGLSLFDGDLQAYAGTLRVIPGSEAGIYAWGVEGNHNLLSNENGTVTVSRIGGILDLRDLADPVAIFGAAADFSGYVFEAGTLGEVELQRASISRSGVDWGELSFSGAGTEFTILELGEGENDDVRIELYNIDGYAGDGGTGIDRAEGTLYFGKLADGGIEPIALQYDGEAHAYRFSTEQVFTYKHDDANSVVLRNVSGTVQRVGEHYTVTFGGEPEVRATILSQIGIDTITADNLTVGSAGFSGNVTATWSAERGSIGLLGGKASLTMRSATVRIDTAEETPIALAAFDGDLDLSPVFDGDEVIAGLGYSAGALRWTLEGTRTLNGDFEFSGLSGTLGLDDLDAIAIGLSGSFGYKGWDAIALELHDFTVDASGLSGGIALAEGTTIPVGSIDGLAITALGIDFGDVIAGNIGIDYANGDFLKPGNALAIGLDAAIDSDGIGAFSIDADLDDMTIENFAAFNFSGVDVNPSPEAFSISLDGTVSPAYSLFNSTARLEFSGLKIAASGLSVDNAGALVEIRGGNASLGGIGVNLRQLGVGFDSNAFYLHAVGGLSLEVVSADAGVYLYSDGRFEVDQIGIEVEQPGFYASGMLKWGSGDAVYGNYFYGDAQLTIVDTINASGSFYIGKKCRDAECTGSYRYWMGQAKAGLGGAGINFGPLSIYAIGGGMADNMSYDAEAEDFVPSEGSKVFMLGTTIGTADSGFTWHGDVDMHIGTSGQVTITGDTYILSSLSSKPTDRRIHGTVTIGTSPASFEISGGAVVAYEGVGVTGPFHVLFEDGEKHIYIGTNSEFARGFNVTEELGPIELSVFGFTTAGYFMIDTRQLAMGMEYRINKHWEKDWWGPNPKLIIDAYARADALVRYNPFWMKARVGAGLDVEACYGACLDLGATVDLEVAMPDPYYIYAKTRVHIYDISVGFSGYIYGSGRGDAAEGDQPQWLDHVEPYADTGVSIVPEMDVYTMFSSVPRGLEVEVSGGLHDTAGHTVGLRAVDLEDGVGRRFVPTRPLDANTTYEFSGTIRVSGEATVGGESVDTGTETFTKRFTTRTTYGLDFGEIVQEVTPGSGREVGEWEPVTITYNRERLGSLEGGVNNTMVTNFAIEVLNSENAPIAGRFSFNTAQLQSRFEPVEAMRAYHYCQNSAGEIRETFQNSDGEYLNPFNGYRVDGAASLADPLPSGDTAAAAVPGYIRTGVLRPQELGVVGQVVQREHETYTYFTNNRYKIVVKDTANGDSVVHYATFKVVYNRASGENLRRFEAMQDQLHPVFTLSRNEAHRNQIMTDFDPGLQAIGAGTAGINYRITTRWTLQTGCEEAPAVPGYCRPVYQSVERTDIDSGSAEFGDDLVRLDSAEIAYYADPDDDGRIEAGESLMATIAMRIEEGESYDTSGAEAARNEAMQNAGNILDGAGMRPGSGGPTGPGGFGPDMGPTGLDGGMPGGGFVGGGIGERMNLGGGF